MTTKMANLICAATITALAAYVAYVFSGLPDPMPTHWDMAGEANGYMSRSNGVATLVSIPVFSILVFKIIPIISPRGYRTEQFSGVVNTLMVGVVIFSCVIAVVAIEAARGADMNISKVVLIGVGLLLAFVGNLMGKTRKNFFIGIRTPWTLASDEVWIKTHRLGGWCLVGAGLLMVISAAINIRADWTILIVVVAVLIPVVYSYFAYRALEGFAPDPEVEEDTNLET